MSVAEPKTRSLLPPTGFPKLPLVVLLVILAFVLLPFLSLAWIALQNAVGVWPHLVQYVLPRTIWQTVSLLFMVSLGTLIAGAGTAWLTTMCDFPGRRFFSSALVLPLAVPGYIAAYTYVEFLDFSGPVQTALREWGGFVSPRDYWFPDIRSLGGAAFIFSAVLYPYVFMTTRLVFAMQGASALDIARCLGASPRRMFWRIGLPMARPAIAAGIALALMETLNDIGAVEILGIKTLTYAVFETWLNRDSLAGAVQLALITLALVAGLVWIERRARQSRAYSTSSRDQPPALIELPATKKVLAIVACTVPIAAGLGIPLYVLSIYALRRSEQILDPATLAAAGNSVLVALLTAALATAIAYGVLQYGRLAKRRQINTIGKISSLGYAVPGTVLAIGLLIPLAAFDNWISAILLTQLGWSPGLLISGSIMIVVYACTLRFLAIAYGTIETAFERLSPHIDMAARALGRTGGQVAFQVHRPIMRRAIGVAFLLVFVDTMKELSATLLLRPFNFETLATLIYDRASQASLEDAAIAALFIVAIGLVPVVVLSNMTSGQAKKTGPVRNGAR